MILFGGEPADGKCDCCVAPGECSVVGSALEGGSDGGQKSGPCNDFVNAVSDPAPCRGLYSCSGGSDDQAEISWAGGSLFFPAAIPSVGPCYGVTSFSFTAYLNKGDSITCRAGSWGGPVSCNFSCTKIKAP